MVTVEPTNGLLVDGATIVWSGKFVRTIVKNGYEFSSRRKGSGVVMVVATVQDDIEPAITNLVLVEQYRPAIGANVIELPAGIAGDISGKEEESIIQAAGRELEEETGYRAENLELIVTGCTSPGIIDERISVVLASGLSKTGQGGGDGTENITVHEVPLVDLAGWLSVKAKDGAVVDLKVFIAPYLVRLRNVGPIA